MEIRHVMTESVVTAAPDQSVREIAALMRERNVARSCSSTTPVRRWASSPTATWLCRADGLPRHPAPPDPGRAALTGIVTLDDLVVRTGDLELAQSVTRRITRAAL